MTWHIKSTTKAQQGLYEYDAVSRLRDSASSATPASPTSATTSSAASCGRPSPPRRPVLLIDEIDKADIEFPNDLLLELDRMEFHVYETGETIRPKSARSS
jgi:MoxR-like ATPase